MTARIINMQRKHATMRILLSEEQIRDKVAELATRVVADYRDEEVYVVCILKGAMVFCADLIRSMSGPRCPKIRLETIDAKSYKGGISTGQVRLTVNFYPKGKHLLIVEDILDTGNTAKSIIDSMRGAGAASVRLCVLLDKHSRREVKITPDYAGFAIGDEFVVGYGLDYNGEHRELPYIAALETCTR
jgi:hypoxanthine phosphoribosyltransferase